MCNRFCRLFFFCLLLSLAHVYANAIVRSASALLPIPMYLSPFLPILLDHASITLARSQAAPAPDAAAPAPSDAPKAADAPADAPKPKKKKVRSLSTLVPVLVIKLGVLLSCLL